MDKQSPVKFWVMGENKWRHADDWPLPETQWTKLYLRNWERLSPEPFAPASVDQFTPPDAFVQMPPSQTNVIQKLRYLSEPLPSDVLIVGPSVLNLFAAIDQDDTNWIVVLKDVANARWADVDCAQAVQNMADAGWALGLGTCWVGNFDGAKIGAMLAVPDGWAIFTILPFGYADPRNPPQAKPLKPRREVVHQERFGN